MKQTFIFLIILTICGSLTKPPVVPACGTKVKTSYYLNGKLVHTDIELAYLQTRKYAAHTYCSLHKKEVGFESDSIVYQVHIPIRKLKP